MPTVLPLPSRARHRPRPVRRAAFAPWGGALSALDGAICGADPRPRCGTGNGWARDGGGDRDGAARGFRIPPSPWGRGGGSPWGPPPQCRQEYQAHAVPARTFAGAIGSVLLAGITLFMGTFPACSPVWAWRSCWPVSRWGRSIAGASHRAPGPACAFLRQPTAWWPGPRHPMSHRNRQAGAL